MDRLPGDVQAELAKAVGAYARDVALQDLPKSLRKFKSFRPQTLRAHATTLIGALEDEVTRKLVLQWLDEKPSLPRRQQELLRIACDRAEGWERELTARSAVPEEPAGEPDEAAWLRDALDKEKDKLRRARADARRAKEGATASQREAAATIKALTDEVAELRRRLADADAAIEAARSAEMGAEERLDKEMRRSRREVEAAAADASEQRRKASEQRRRATQLQRRVTELERRLEAKGRRARPPSPAEGEQPSRRDELPAPLGLLPDAPETLEAWLGHDDVILVVDGYNVVLGEAAYEGLDLADQRDRLVDALGGVARRTNTPTIVVFDGSEVPPGTARRSRGSVRVEYSQPQETADDHIVALLEELPPAPVVVVTSDRELQDRVRGRGATIATSSQLLSLLR